MYIRTNVRLGTQAFLFLMRESHNKAFLCVQNLTTNIVLAVSQGPC